ncbi:MAG TPA: hypothetical protein VF054_20875 [Micromonosporaceae bacterium]
MAPYGDHFAWRHGREPAGTPKPLTGGSARLLMLVAALLALLGLPLFAAATRLFFAWTVPDPLAAVSLGGAYWASAAGLWVAARVRRWADARVVVPGSLVYTVATVVVALVHRDTLHPAADSGAVTLLATWLWLAVYLVVPVLLAVTAVGQWRIRGTTPPRGRPTPRWLWSLVAVQAVALLAVGGILLFAPGYAGRVWPWQLTSLTAQATGAWLVGLGVVTVQVLVERDPRRARPAAVIWVALAAVQLLTMVRYPGQFPFGSPGSLGYLLVVVIGLVSGARILTGAGPDR